MTVTSFGKQKYGKIKKSCISRKILFQDHLFQASDASLMISKSKLPGKVEWKRPYEICDNPKLVKDRVSRLSANQGMLGNCWFVAAISALASHSQLWNKVIPNLAHQEFSPDKRGYAGIFHFTFYHFGKWVDVVVDDRLPTVRNRLIFTHSTSPNEFWCALLEKAYAKLCGSYKNLETGNLIDALVDFTGGFAEIVDLQESGINNKQDATAKKDLFKRMIKELDSHSLMCCAIKALGPSEMQKRTRMGLVKGHAYCVTAVRKIHISGTGLLSIFKGREKISMIRLRNPWGEKEWSGAFSDGVEWCYSVSHLNRLLSSSPEWQKVTDSERRKMGLTFEEDGEFWMTFDDFCKYFTTLSICHLMKTSWFALGVKWYETSLYGQWDPHSNRAGGCANNGTSFLNNPQYLFDVPDKTDNTLMMMLQQEDPRRRQAKTLSMGFTILKVEQNRKYRLHTIRKQVSTSEYIESRNVFHACVLNAGRYVLIPTTFRPGLQGSYLMRIFSTNGCQLREMLFDVPPPPFWPWTKYPKTATYIQVKQALGLQQVDGKDPDTYCVATWGKLKMISEVVPNSSSPSWELSFVEYKVKLTKPITIQVWKKSVLSDACLAVATLDVPVNLKSEIYTLPLRNPKQPDSGSVGKIQVIVFTTTDFMKA